MSYASDALIDALQRENRKLTAEKEALTQRIDELCQEVERLKGENAAFTGRSIRAGDKMACLETENAKLREERREYQTTIDSLVDECTDHKDENTKLRELVREMYDYASQRSMELCNACTMADGEFADCAACGEYDGACGIAKKRFEELYADHMRELGIEVPA